MTAGSADAFGLALTLSQLWLDIALHPQHLVLI